MRIGNKLFMTLAAMAVVLTLSGNSTRAESWISSDAKDQLQSIRRDSKTIALSIQANTPPAPPKEVRYVRESVEYRAACVQAFRNGWRSVLSAAADQSGDWAVVLDVDETVLDNSEYQIENPKYDPKTWDAWVRREEAGSVPGAKEFLERVRSLGSRAHVVFITDRTSEQETPTIENMRKNGLFKDGDVILSKTGSQDNKGIRRECIESGSGRCQAYGPMSIIALFGDSLRDFLEIYGIDSATLTRDGVLQDPRWGEQFFVIPNPMYGQWERDYK